MLVNYLLVFNILNYISIHEYTKGILDVIFLRLVGRESLCLWHMVNPMMRCSKKGDIGTLVINW